MAGRRLSRGRRGGAGREPASAADELRVFPVVDRWFIGWVVAELVAWAVFPALPLVVWAAGFATPMGRSRRRMIVLGVIAALLGLLAAAPFLIGLLDLQLVENGPVQVVRPG